MLPDAATVLAAMIARLGRVPSLMELLAEMVTPSSGTPSVPPPAGPVPDGVLSTVLGLQDLDRMANRAESCPGPLHTPTPWEGQSVPSRGGSHAGHPFPFPAPGGRPLGVRP